MIEYRKIVTLVDGMVKFPNCLAGCPGKIALPSLFICKIQGKFAGAQSSAQAVSTIYKPAFLHLCLPLASLPERSLATL